MNGGSNIDEICICHKYETKSNHNGLMDLILWRHAEANEIEDDEDDLSRVLTVRGEKQAQRMSVWLERQLPDTVKIWSSPAVRAEQTVLALGRKYKVRDELSPCGDVTHLLELAQWPYNKNSVLIVTHQPLISQVISKILGIKEEKISIKKCSVWWLRARAKDNKIETSLVNVQSPDML